MSRCLPLAVVAMMISAQGAGHTAHWESYGIRIRVDRRGHDRYK